MCQVIQSNCFFYNSFYTIQSIIVYNSILCIIHKILTNNLQESDNLHAIMTVIGECAKIHDIEHWWIYSSVDNSFMTAFTVVMVEILAWNGVRIVVEGSWNTHLTFRLTHDMSQKNIGFSQKNRGSFFVLVWVRV